MSNAIGTYLKRSVTARDSSASSIGRQAFESRETAIPEAVDATSVDISEQIVARLQKSGPIAVNDLVKQMGRSLGSTLSTLEQLERFDYIIIDRSGANAMIQLKN